MYLLIHAGIKVWFVLAKGPLVYTSIIREYLIVTEHMKQT